MALEEPTYLIVHLLSVRIVALDTSFFYIFFEQYFLLFIGNFRLVNIYKLGFTGNHLFYYILYSYR